MSFQARIALEWFQASGPRTVKRLRELVRHQCYISAISDEETIAAIERQALEAAQKIIERT